MTRSVPFVTPLLALALPASAASAAGSWDARLLSASGSVTVTSHEGSTKGRAGLPLDEGDAVRTGGDGRADIGFEDRGIVELGPHSALTLSSTGKSKTELSLSSGWLLAKFMPLGEGRFLRVRGGSAVASVRGTEFGVRDLDDGGTAVGVFEEGLVLVAGASGAPQFLKPGTESVTLPGQAAGEAGKLKVLADLESAMDGLREQLDGLRAPASLTPEKRAALRRSLIQSTSPEDAQPDSAQPPEETPKDDRDEDSGASENRLYNQPR